MRHLKHRALSCPGHSEEGQEGQILASVPLQKMLHLSILQAMSLTLLDPCYILHLLKSLEEFGVLQNLVLTLLTLLCHYK